MTTLIKNGRVVTATDDFKGDVFIDGEKVCTIGKSLSMAADRTIDASGKLVIPGGIDPHVHMELPFGGTVSSDDFRTGTIAADSRRGRSLQFSCPGTYSRRGVKSRGARL